MALSSSLAMYLTIRIGRLQQGRAGDDCAERQKRRIFQMISVRGRAQVWRKESARVLERSKLDLRWRWNTISRVRHEVKRGAHTS